MYPKRRKIAVLSDMKELGETAGRYHREIGTEAAKIRSTSCACGANGRCVCRGGNRRGHAQGFGNGFRNKAGLADFLAGILTDNDVVLVKGSAFHENGRNREAACR